GAVSFTSGKANVTATLDKAATQSIVAQDTTTPSINGTTGPITVTAAAASQLLISESTSTPTASSTTNVTFSVTAEDAFGNPIASFGDSVTLTDSVTANNTISALSPFNVNGVATATGTLETAGLQTITAHDSTNVLIPNATTQLSVNAAAATHLVVNASPTSLPAGSASQVSITAEDQFNNIATSFSDTVSLTDSLGGAVFNSISFTAGKATVAATLN